ncbi:MAG: hypothetical protein HS101_06730 [Planctomycetia bacterium]|nr:hypothetical protein [Planctomycetia bacterium]
MAWVSNAASLNANLSLNETRIAQIMATMEAKPEKHTANGTMFAAGDVFPATTILANPIVVLRINDATKNQVNLLRDLARTLSGILNSNSLTHDSNAITPAMRFRCAKISNACHKPVARPPRNWLDVINANPMTRKNRARLLVRSRASNPPEPGSGTVISHEPTPTIAEVTSPHISSVIFEW